MEKNMITFNFSDSKKHALVLGLTYELMSHLIKATVSKLEEMITNAETSSSVEPATSGLENGGGVGSTTGGIEEVEDDIKKGLGGCRRRIRRRFGSDESLSEYFELEKWVIHEPPFFSASSDETMT